MSLETIIDIPGFTEPFSSLSHLLAAGVFLIMGVYLVVNGRGKASSVISLLVFIFSYLFLLSMSGVYHLLENGGAGRMVVQRLDHAGIFFLIAGTFTPVHTILFRGRWQWGMLLLIWTIAATNITLKIIYFDEIPEWIGLFMFLGMGWVGAISGLLLYKRFGLNFIKPLLYGAFAYTLGAVMEFLRWPELIPGYIGPHELFHVAVLFGLGYHFLFIYSFADHDHESPITIDENDIYFQEKEKHSSPIKN